MYLYDQSIMLMSNLNKWSKFWYDLQAASLRIAEQYIQAFSNIAKEVKKMNYQESCTLLFTNKLLCYWSFPYIFLPFHSFVGYHDVAS